MRAGLARAAMIVVVTAAAVGIVFAMVDHHWGLARWDRGVADWGRDHATDGSTDVWTVVTHLGGTALLMIVGLAVAGVHYGRHRDFHGVLHLLAVVTGVALVNNALKWVIQRPRPDVPHLVDAAGSAFPSGHASAAAAAWCAFAVVLAGRWPPWRRAIATTVAVVIALAVAASRVLLGVHWLTDVIAGLLVGWGWFLFCDAVLGDRVRQPSPLVAGPGEGEAAGGPQRGLRAPEVERSGADAAAGPFDR